MIPVCIEIMKYAIFSGTIDPRKTIFEMLRELLPDNSTAHTDGVLNLLRLELVYHPDQFIYTNNLIGIERLY